MSTGSQITDIRKKQNMTQEEFGSLFHVTRQTVSNWENEKSYPDLQTLVDLSDQFDVSLDTLLKGDAKMVQQMDRERMWGTMKREKSVIDFFTGTGTGILASCLFSPDSPKRMLMIAVGFVLISIGRYRKANYDNKLLGYLKGQENQ